MPEAFSLRCDRVTGLAVATPRPRKRGSAPRIGSDKFRSLVPDVQEREATAIESAAYVVVITFGKSTASIQTNLVQHARKVEDASHRVVRTARQLFVHGVCSRYGPDVTVKDLYTQAVTESQNETSWSQFETMLQRSKLFIEIDIQ
jgi:hypothetical protein